MGDIRLYRSGTYKTYCTYDYDLDFYAIGCTCIFQIAERGTKIKHRRLDEIYNFTFIADREVNKEPGLSGKKEAIKKDFGTTHLDIDSNDQSTIINISMRQVISRLLVYQRA